MAATRMMMRNEKRRLTFNKRQLVPGGQGRSLTIPVAGHRPTIVVLGGDKGLEYLATIFPDLASS